VEKLKKKSLEIRRNIIEMVSEAKSGHPGGSLGMTDVFVALYYEVLNINPKYPKDPNRDYLFLSNGHICPVLYATLAEKGFFPKKELLSFRKLNSRLQGHPHKDSLPGVENTSGPLGQGLSVAVGAALALKSNNKQNKVFVICGDGELNEGMVWEAFMSANKYCLDNLTIIIDKNNLQLDGPTAEIMGLGDLKQKLLSFGFHVFECDGHNFEDLLLTLKLAIKHKGGCKVIFTHTTMGKGVSFMENNYEWHGKAPNAEEKKIALEELI
jgi:transketolase